VVKMSTLYSSFYNVNFIHKWLNCQHCTQVVKYQHYLQVV